MSWCYLPHSSCYWWRCWPWWTPGWIFAAELIDRHPVAEIATLRALEEELPEDRSLAGLTPFLDRYLERPYVALPDAFGEEVTDPELYFRRLRPILEDEDVKIRQDPTLAREQGGAAAVLRAGEVAHLVAHHTVQPAHPVFASDLENRPLG